MDENEEKRKGIHRGVEEIDISSGESLGSPVSEGSGIDPEAEEEEEEEEDS